MSHGGKNRREWCVSQLGIGWSLQHRHTSSSSSIPAPHKPARRTSLETALSLVHGKGPLWLLCAQGAIPPSLLRALLGPKANIQINYRAPSGIP